MGAFGDKLRREREMRGVTLVEISESTKVSKRWLQALEDEEFGVLPGGVFNRGFVRAYAHFIGINEEEAVEDYIAASNEQPPPEDKFPLEIHEKPDTPPLNPKRSRLPVLLAILGLLVLVAGWTFWVKYKSQQSAAEKQSPANISSAENNEAPVRASANSPDNSEKQAEAKQTAENGQANRNKEQNQTRVIRINARQSSAGDGSGQDAGAAFSVVIKAKENSWISIAVDGKTLWKGMLNPNEERSVTADKELILKTGNAAGIEVSYNGKTLGTLGKDNEVRTLTFNTGGLQQ